MIITYELFWNVTTRTYSSTTYATTLQERTHQQRTQQHYKNLLINNVRNNTTRTYSSTTYATTLQERTHQQRTQQHYKNVLINNVRNNAALLISNVSLCHDYFVTFVIYGQCYYSEISVTISALTRKSFLLGATGMHVHGMSASMKTNPTSHSKMSKEFETLLK